MKEASAAARPSVCITAPLTRFEITFFLSLSGLESYVAASPAKPMHNCNVKHDIGSRPMGPLRAH